MKTKRMEYENEYNFLSKSTKFNPPKLMRKEKGKIGKSTIITLALI